MLTSLNLGLSLKGSQKIHINCISYISITYQLQSNNNNKSRLQQTLVFDITLPSPLFGTKGWLKKLLPWHHADPSDQENLYHLVHPYEEKKKNKLIVTINLERLVSLRAATF